MPKIVITETEQEVKTIVNAIENTVLVPIVCIPGSTTAAELYAPEKRLSFVSTYNTKAVKEPINGTQAAEKSVIYANMLLNKGLNVVVKPILASVTSFTTEAELTTFLNDSITAGALEEFNDKNTFNLKFITTGAHANILSSEATSESEAVISGCYSTLATIAAYRGDCIALMELEDDITCSSNYDDARDIKNILATDSPATDEIYKFAACVFPWGSYNVNNGSTTIETQMPASFGYLEAFANAVSTYSDWYATAGVIRGAIPDLKELNVSIGESQMHILLNEEKTKDTKYIKFNINPIMKVSEYGVKIWGNRVAWVNSTTEAYMSYLNIRLLLCDIKKQIYYAATRVTFEPNDMITWLSFQQLVNELLDTMKSDRGIEWYSWRRQATSSKATIKAILSIKPIEAVEYFDITVNLTDEQAEVTEI